MKAKMLNQLIQRGKENLKKWEKKSGRELDKDIWSTVYITDIPIQILTDEAVTMINDFIERHFKDKEVKDFTVERNGMLGFWQFTVMTFKEVTEFDIEEETDEERRARLMPIAEQWWDKLGSLSDKYQSYDWRVHDVTEENGGNRIVIQMWCDFGGYTEILERNDKGGWTWREDEEN